MVRSETIVDVIQNEIDEFEELARAEIREQRRYEIAKAAMEGLLSGSAWHDFNEVQIANLATQHADALLARLEHGDDNG